MPDRGHRTASRALRVRWLLALACLLLADGSVSAGGAAKAKETMRFAASMAKSGNWREAGYRWELVDRMQPDSPRILNNLAVAAEALGRLDKAREYYDRALTLAGNDQHIRDNFLRFDRFWRRYHGDENDEAGDGATPAKIRDASKGGKSGKVQRVTVGLPVPPRLEIEPEQSLLVASFLTQETSLLDTNRELVRFLRGEFRKRTELDVLPVVPPPAIPEQTIEDLLANTEFWKHLSREYDADLIVSGVVNYDSQDVSGFQDVDTISSRTGQKVRRMQFVDQEKFEYTLDVFFIDGPSGTLQFRDRIRRSLVFRGQANDPISAFYELSESIARDVIGVVTSRTRTEPRVIFKG